MKTDIFLSKVLAALTIAGILFTGCDRETIQQSAPLQRNVPAEVAGSGHTVFIGTNTPVISVGQQGDYYLNKSEGALYGPKNSLGWNLLVQLKGSGPQAYSPDTSRIMVLGGNGTPAMTTGGEGDYYLDKTDNDLYGPKTSGKWGTGLELNGKVNEKVYVIPMNLVSWKLDTQTPVAGTSHDTLYSFSATIGPMNGFYPGVEPNSTLKVSIGQNTTLYTLPDGAEPSYSLPITKDPCYLDDITINYQLLSLPGNLPTLLLTYKLRTYYPAIPAGELPAGYFTTNGPYPFLKITCKTSSDGNP